MAEALIGAMQQRSRRVSRTPTCFIGVSGSSLLQQCCSPDGSPRAGQMTKLLNNALAVSNLRDVLRCSVSHARRGQSRGFAGGIGN
jgi:hypothetical protein